MSLFEDNGAIFNEDRTHRYVLWRKWDKENEMISFIGLNPSTADETTNDPTVTRCINFARDWGYGGMYMLNLFGFRATDPDEMRAVDEPVGARNNAFLQVYGNPPECDIVVLCWGNHGMHNGRSDEVKDFFDSPYCFDVNKSGQPKHPLYLPAESKPLPYNPHKLELV